MTRRTLFQSLAFAPFASAPFASAQDAPADAPALIRPRVLRPGDTVGLITPSTYVTDPDRLTLAERTLRYFGLNAKWGKNVGRRAKSLRSSVSERLEDLHAMFADASVNAVFAVRGGYGSEQLLDRIDYDLIRRNPKIFVGYSDITALHIAINRYSGLVTFHGPMPLSPFTDYSQKYFRKAMFDTAPLGLITNPPETNPLRPAHELTTIRGGRATGQLIGGNMTLISTTLGTPYEIQTRGRILFIEDTGEEPYRIDRMLTQLRLAGKFDSAAGLVWGECQECGPRDFQPSTASPFTLGEIIQGILGDLKIPVLGGLTFGHTADQATIPEGVMAMLDADAQQLTITQSATVAAGSAAAG